MPLNTTGKPWQTSGKADRGRLDQATASTQRREAVAAWDLQRTAYDALAEQKRWLRQPLVGHIFRMAGRLRLMGRLWALQKNFYDLLNLELDRINADYAKILSTLSGDYRLHTSFVRLLVAKLEQNGLLKPDHIYYDAVAIIVAIEAAHPELAAAPTVEISIQDVRAEDELEALVAHRPGQLRPYACHVWFHFDLSERWNRPALFDAVLGKKLRDGGFFVLITNVNNTGLNHSALVRVTVDSIRSGQRELLYYVFQKPLPIKEADAD